MVLIEPFSSVITSQARQSVAGMEVVVVVISVAVVCWQVGHGLVVSCPVFVEVSKVVGSTSQVGQAVDVVVIARPVVEEHVGHIVSVEVNTFVVKLVSPLIHVGQTVPVEVKEFVVVLVEPPLAVHVGQVVSVEVNEFVVTPVDSGVQVGQIVPVLSVGKTVVPEEVIEFVVVSENVFDVQVGQLVPVGKAVVSVDVLFQ